jgi:SAM-dependent methyltransferase
MYQLFNAFAHRYDLHTPPDHYRHDHQLVLDLSGEHGPGCRILDIGCGTAVLLEKALAAGYDAYGLDASEGMVTAAIARVPAERLRVQRMQELDEFQRYDLVVSLSWSIHHCSGEVEFADILRRIRRALAPRGRLLLQIAHSANISEEWVEDKEIAPDGTPDGVSLRFRFRRDPSAPGRLLADYAYRCPSLGEAVEETQTLEVADANVVQRSIRAAGFTEVLAWDSWRREPLSNRADPFVSGRRL